MSLVENVKAAFAEANRLRDEKENMKVISVFEMEAIYDAYRAVVSEHEPLPPAFGLLPTHRQLAWRKAAHRARKNDHEG